MPFSSLSHLECSRTGDRYDADLVLGVSEVVARQQRRPDGAQALYLVGFVALTGARALEVGES